MLCTVSSEHLHTRRHIHSRINKKTKTRYWFSLARQLQRGWAPVHSAATDCCLRPGKTPPCVGSYIPQWVVWPSPTGVTEQTGHILESGPICSSGVLKLCWQVVCTCQKWPLGLLRSMGENMQPEGQLPCVFSEDCNWLKLLSTLVVAGCQCSALPSVGPRQYWRGQRQETLSARFP